MIDLPRIIVVGYLKTNGLKEGELQKMNRSRESAFMRAELRWLLQTLTSASESYVKSQTGTSTRMKRPLEK